MPKIGDFLSELDSRHTRRAYSTDLRRFMQEMGMQESNPDFSTLETQDLETFLRSMQESDLSTATIRRRMAAIRRFFDWLVSEGDISHNPCRAASLTVEESEEPSQRNFLSKDDIHALLRAINQNTRTGTRDRALILLVLYGALRRSEVASLDVDDVRPLGRHWVIDLARQGQASGGYVKIPNRVADVVQTFVDIYDDDSGPLWRSFSNRNWGERLSDDALYKRVRRLGKEAGLEKVNIQILRQSALRIASESGASLDQIQDQARLKRETSAVEYVGAASQVSGLQSSAADFLELDV